MPEAVRDRRRPADVEAAPARVAGLAFGIPPDACGPAAGSAITGCGLTLVPRPTSTPAEWDG
jgi:hypothetical protein